MAFVIKRSDGMYIKGRTRWTFTWVPDLNKARVYARKGDASLSLNQMREPDAAVVEVDIVEKD